MTILPPLPPLSESHAQLFKGSCARSFLVVIILTGLHSFNSDTVPRGVGISFATDNVKMGFVEAF